MRWISVALVAVFCLWPRVAQAQVGVDDERTLKSGLFVSLYDFGEERRAQNRWGETIVFVHPDYPEDIKLMTAFQDDRLVRAELAVSRELLGEEDEVDNSLMELAALFIEQMVCVHDRESSAANLKRLLALANPVGYLDGSFRNPGMEVFFNRSKQYEERYTHCGLAISNIGRDRAEWLHLEIWLLP